MNRRVLIVEDNEDIRSIYGIFLRYFGYEVLEADNGYMGVEIARREKPDAIVMDIAMPILDGLEATQALKSDTETADIPVLFVTAHSVQEHRRRAQELGCSGFIGKPVEPQRLVLELQRVLGDPVEEPTPLEA